MTVFVRVRPSQYIKNIWEELVFCLISGLRTAILMWKK